MSQAAVLPPHLQIILNASPQAASLLQMVVNPSTHIASLLQTVVNPSTRQRHIQLTRATKSQLETIERQTNEAKSSVIRKSAGVSLFCKSRLGKIGRQSTEVETNRLSQMRSGRLLVGLCDAEIPDPFLQMTDMAVWPL